ncbi:MAG: LmeA family phospholipid-binding protein [Thermaerobacter sp.]|nr:LmeA family phospholipid-binding protein [Thermaerobacter sp.]
MNALRVALVVILVAVLGQVLVPPVVAGRAAAALHGVTGAGSTDQVAVTAVPFWTLAFGQTQDVRVLVDSATVPVDGQPLRIAQMTLNWQDGQVAVGALLRQGRLVAARAGRVRFTLKVDGPAVAQFLDASGRVQGAVVTVGAHQVTLTGQVALGSLRGHVSTRGRLAISPNGQELLFVPQELDGLSLPLAASLPLFDLPSLNLPLPMHLTSVVLAPPDIVVQAASP